MPQGFQHSGNQRETALLWIGRKSPDRVQWTKFWMKTAQDRERGASFSHAAMLSCK
jgi:hypothetical protein